MEKTHALADILGTLMLLSTRSLSPRWLGTAAAIIVLLAARGAAGQTDEAGWPQWRGPLGTGAVERGQPPLEWSETQNIRWKVPLPGEGSSTPIVWGNQVFVVAAIVTDRVPDQPVVKDERALTSPPGTIVEFQVLSLDRNSGQTLWQRTVTAAAPHEGRHTSSTYAAASPITDGERLYASFGSYGIFALTLDGELLWSRQLGTMHTRRGWGEAVSPALARDRLIVMWDQEDQSRIYALDPASGEIVWQQDRDEPTTWATPLVIPSENGEQVITAGTNRIRSYRAGDGHLLWESEGLTLNAIPSPVAVGNHVICMSGYRGNAAVSLDLDAPGQPPSIDWKIDRDTPYVPSPCLTRGRLYFTKGLAAVLNCVDVETGKPYYPLTRLEGLQNLYASPVATPDYVYIVSREGATLVLRNSDRFERVALNRLDAAIDASPAIVGDQLFLRSKTHLYCLQEDPLSEKTPPPLP